MTAVLLFVGDVGWDITLQVSHMPGRDEKVHAQRVVESVGGVVANASVAAARAGAVTRGLFCFGADERGDAAAFALGAAGVDIVGGTRHGPSSLAVTFVGPDGEKHLVLGTTASMYPSVEAIEAVDLGGVNWVHTALYSTPGAACLVERCRSARIPWSIDLEPATFASGIDALADLLDGAAVVFCNALAVERIGVDTERVLHQMGARALVFTRGSYGAELRTVNGRAESARPVPAPIRVVDTTGAGDCLAGWFLAERAAGVDVGSALNRAVSAATFSCTRLGAQPSYPTAAELRTYLESVTESTGTPEYDKER